MSEVAPPPARAEHTFLSEGNVQVTNARLVCNGQTYAMAGVTSVRTAVEPASSFGTVLAIIGGVIFLIGAGNSSAAGAIWGVGILVCGILIQRTLKAKHHLVLHSSSGEVRAISSTDGAFIARILAAINDAIVSRS